MLQSIMPKKVSGRLSSSDSSSSDTQSDPEFERIKLPKHLRARSPNAPRESSPTPDFPIDKESARASSRDMATKLQAAIETARNTGRSRSRSVQVRSMPVLDPQGAVTTPTVTTPTVSNPTAATAAEEEEALRQAVLADKARDRLERERRDKSRDRSRSPRRKQRNRVSASGPSGSRLAEPKYEIAELREAIGDLQRKAEFGEIKFSRSGTEKNAKFAEDVRQTYSVEMRRILRRIFTPAEVPKTILDQLAKGDALVADRIHVMRIADEYGWQACLDFQKEELARTSEEARKIKRLRKEKALQIKQEREKKDKEADTKRRSSTGSSSGWRSDGRKKSVCYRCNRTGHIARQCWDTSSYDRRKSGGREDIKSEKKNDK